MKLILAYGEIKKTSKPETLEKASTDKGKPYQQQTPVNKIKHKKVNKIFPIIW